MKITKCSMRGAQRVRATRSAAQFRNFVENTLCYMRGCPKIAKVLNFAKQNISLRISRKRPIFECLPRVVL